MANAFHLGAAPLLGAARSVAARGVAPGAPGAPPGPRWRPGGGAGEAPGPGGEGGPGLLPLGDQALLGPRKVLGVGQQGGALEGRGGGILAGQHAMTRPGVGRPPRAAGGVRLRSGAAEGSRRERERVWSGGGLWGMRRLWGMDVLPPPCIHPGEQ